MDNTSATILIVDDVELNRAILSEIFSKTSHILEAENGREAVELLETQGDMIDLILLDIVMPVMDGFDVLKIMNQRGWIHHIPVIMISAETAEDFVLQGYELGVSDYISRPFSPSIVSKRVSNIIDLYRHRNQLMKMVGQQTKKLKQSNLFMIDTLSTAVEFRNGESGMHIRRVRKITELLLNEVMVRFPQYRISEEQKEEIINAAALHDLGKITIPEHILNKPGKLTPSEFEIMKQHTTNGAQILLNNKYMEEQTYIKYCYNICYYHHERWDGNGYPKGLKGNQIPLSAQIVSIADVYDALTSKRIYKPPYTHEKALSMILEGECGVFNPQLLECLLVYKDTMEEELKQLESHDFIQSEEPYSLNETLPQEERISDRTLHLLELEREKYHTLAALSGELLFDFDVVEDTLKFSEKFKELFDSDILITDVMKNIRKGEFPLLTEKGHKTIITLSNTISAEYPFAKDKLQMIMKNERLVWFEVVLRSLWSDDGRCRSIIGKITNIQERIDTEQRLEEKASRDSLTGLYNRAAAECRIEKILQKDSAVGTLLFIDIDDFKQINDNFGHQYGDNVLISIAEIIKSNFRGVDVSCRFGGDEFVIFMSMSNDQTIIQKKISELYQLLRNNATLCNLRVTISVGIARYPEDGTTFQTLLDKADQALYSVKAKGKNGFVFYENELSNAGLLSHTKID